MISVRKQESEYISRSQDTATGGVRIQLQESVYSIRSQETAEENSSRSWDTATGVKVQLQEPEYSRSLDTPAEIRIQQQESAYSIIKRWA
jgi:hypothetical protein